MKRTKTVFAFLLFAAAAGVSGAQSGTYEIGDTGPAGGIVFYDKGYVSDGWRYLEAAPASTEFMAEWGAFEEYLPAGTEESVGSGRRNTRLVVDWLNRTGEIGRAAQECAAMSVNGFSDWFLPSIGELDLMYENLKRKSLGSFGGNWYWSSSQNSMYYAWVQSFVSGGWDDGDRDVAVSVRAVRAF